MVEVFDAADSSAAVQRDFNTPEKWAHKNIATFSKGKCKVLQLGMKNPMLQSRLGLTCW